MILRQFLHTRPLVAAAYLVGCLGKGLSEAVTTGRARSFKVRRLQDGLPNWKAAGLPIEAVAG